MGMKEKQLLMSELPLDHMDRKMHLDHGPIC